LTPYVGPLDITLSDNFKLVGFQLLYFERTQVCSRNTSRVLNQASTILFAGNLSLISGVNVS